MTSKYQVPAFLRRDEESLLFNNNEGEFVFFVPEVYFTRNDAVLLGEYVQLFGVLDYAIKDKNDKYGKLRQFKFPTVFMTRPSSIEKVKDLKLTKTSDPSDYRLLKYKKDDVIVTSVRAPQDVDNMEWLFRIFVINARLPTTVRYDEMHEYFIENAALNGQKYKLNLQLFGILVSKIARDKNNPEKLFRLTDIKDMTDYSVMSVADIPKYMSPYASIVSQNWDEAVMSSILSTKKETSPLQQIMMG